MEDLLEKYKVNELKKRMIICFFLGLAIPGYIFYLDHEEYSANLDGARQRKESAIAKRNRNRRTVKELPRLRKDVADINKSLDEARRFLPEKIDFNKMLAVLGNLENDLDVKIVKFAPQKERRPSNAVHYLEVPLNLELRSEFSKVMIFLDRLMHRSELVSIKSLKFSPHGANKTGGAGDSLDQPQVDVFVEVVFFRRNLG